MTNALLRLPRVRELTGLSRSSIYRLAQAGDFPRPIKLGQRASAWSAEQVQHWIASRVAAALRARAGVGGTIAS